MKTDRQEVTPRGGTPPSAAREVKGERREVKRTCNTGERPYFYDAWKAAIYDARTAAEWADRDLDFYLGLAREFGGPVLELACGTGRVLLPLARAGYEVMGVDLSPHMLEVADRKLASEPREVRSRVRLVEDELARFDLGRRFALILIPARSFQFLLTREDQRRCLAACARHLWSEGRLVLDVFNPRLSRVVAGAEDLKNEFPGPEGEVLRVGGTAEYDQGEQMLHDQVWTERLTPDGPQRLGEEELRLRYFFRYEVEWMLEACGFEVEALYGDFDRTPFTAESPEILPVARRREQEPGRREGT